jgi:hypothetical protein
VPPGGGDTRERGPGQGRPCCAPRASVYPSVKWAGLGKPPAIPAAGEAGVRRIVVGGRLRGERRHPRWPLPGKREVPGSNPSAASEIGEKQEKPKGRAGVPRNSGAEPSWDTGAGAPQMWQCHRALPAHAPGVSTPPSLPVSLQSHFLLLPPGTAWHPAARGRGPSDPATGTKAQPVLPQSGPLLRRTSVPALSPATPLSP